MLIVEQGRLIDIVADAVRAESGGLGGEEEVDCLVSLACEIAAAHSLGLSYQFSLCLIVLILTIEHIRSNNHIIDSKSSSYCDE